jgi:2-keto-4-pentenoate hydratase/2-oxohepta-3-ene-1,7-dioic acid hydratase in catechol pathway
MKWVTYDSDGTDRLGLVLDSEIHGLADGIPLVDLLGDDGERLAEAGQDATDNPVEVRPLADATLRSPLQPPSIRDFLCFLEHLRNCRKAADLGELDEGWQQIPAFYFSNTAGVIGSGEQVPISPGSERFDFELEAAAVIGKAGSDLDPDTAAAHIAGYTILCDWSARDLQVAEMKLGLGPAKGKDSRNSLGPAFVTADEFAPYASGNAFAVQMSAHVNDEYVGGGSMDQMDWSWGEIASYASRGTTLRPGDVLGSGTVPTGCLLEHLGLHGQEKFRGWLQPGDRVRLEIDHIGALEHEIVAGPPVHRLRTGF